MEAHNNDSGSFERNADTGRVRDSQLQSHKQKGYQKKVSIKAWGGRTRVNDPVIFTPVTYTPKKKKKKYDGKQ